MQLPISAVRSGEVTELMRENLISEGGISYIQVSPVFLYESLWCLLLFLILLAVKRKRSFTAKFLCFIWLDMDWEGFSSNGFVQISFIFPEQKLVSA